MRILHLADLHLGWKPAYMPPDLAEKRRAERNDVLRRAVDAALEPKHGIQMVVVAGDLFEDYKPEKTLADAAMAQLRRLTAADLPVITVPGNHDEITYPESIYQVRGSEWPGILVTNPNPEQVATIAVGSTPVHVYSLAYTGGITRTRPPIDSFPRSAAAGIHLAIFHGTLGEWGGDRSLPIDKQALGQAGYDYVALGHIHKASVEQLGQGLAVYPGAIAGKGFDDLGCGELTIAHIDPGNTKIEKVALPIAKMALFTKDVSGCGDASEIAAAVSRLADPNLIARVTLTGAPPILVNPSDIETSCGFGFKFLEVVDATDTVSPELLELWAAEPTIMGHFINRMKERLDAAADADEQTLIMQALRRGVSALRVGVV